jgi:hypothetical protein
MTGSRSQGEVNRMLAAAIDANPKWFWHGPDTYVRATALSGKIRT